MNEWYARFRHIHEYRKAEGIEDTILVIGAGNIITPGAHPVRISPPINDNERKSA